MSCHVQTEQDCAACEHHDGPCERVRTAVSLAAAAEVELCCKRGETLPPLTVTIWCPCFWRRVSGHR